MTNEQRVELSAAMHRVKQCLDMMEKSYDILNDAVDDAVDVAKQISDIGGNLVAKICNAFDYTYELDFDKARRRFKEVI